MGSGRCTTDSMTRVLGVAACSCTGNRQTMCLWILVLDCGLRWTRFGLGGSGSRDGFIGLTRMSLRFPSPFSFSSSGLPHPSRRLRDFEGLLDSMGQCGSATGVFSRPESQSTIRMDNNVTNSDGSDWHRPAQNLDFRSKKQV